MNNLINKLLFSVLVLTFITGGYAQGGKESLEMTLNTCDFPTNVDVEATGGTNAGYPSLIAAFNAINNGQHTGNINIEICQSHFQPGTAVLNGSGAGFANYTNVSIYPLLDNISIEAQPAAGRGIIELNGASNIFIDGDSPNSGGPNRNLTLHDPSAQPNLLTSLIRIATQPGGAATANNISIRHMKLLGGVNNGNSSFYGTGGGIADYTFGVYVGGGGGATPTSTPTAITSVTADAALASTTINNFEINDNTFNTVGRAIVFNSADPSVANSVRIINNNIGDQGNASPATPPFTTPVSTVYSKGIWVAGANSYDISKNFVKNIMSHMAGTPMHGIEINGAIGSGDQIISSNEVSNVANNSNTQTQVKGIVLGASAGGNYTISRNTVSNIQGVLSGAFSAVYVTGIEVNTGAVTGLIERNSVTGVSNNNVSTTAARGIDLQSGTNVVVRNNMISRIVTNQTDGHSYDVNYATFGLRITGGTGHKIFHNSIHLTGPLPGTPNVNLLTAAFGVTNTAVTGLDVRNNVFSDFIAAGTFPSANVSMYMPAGGDSNMNLTLNNNDLNSGLDISRQGILQAGLIPNTGFYKANTFNSNDTSAPNNMRTYTSTLSAGGMNDSSTVTFDPDFISASNLHITNASQLINLGDPSVGVPRDFDHQFRVGVPDIGADEPGGQTPFLLDIAATAFVTPANQQTFNPGNSVTPTATFTNQGTSTWNDIDVRFTITGPGSYNYVGNFHIPALVTEQVININFAQAPAFTQTGVYNMSAAVVTAGDQNAANDVINGTFSVIAPLNGSYNVPGDFPSLTNTNGVFDVINSQGVTGNVIINVTADLTAETGAIALNHFAGGHTIVIQSAGAARVIEGDAPTSLIQFNGADGVTFSGAAFGDPRGLTIRNTNDTSGSVFLYYNDASNNAIVNCIVEQNNLTPAVSYSFADTTGNDNNSINGSLIKGISPTFLYPTSSIQASGASTLAPSSGLVIENNELRGFRQNGIAMTGGNENFRIAGNLIVGGETMPTSQNGMIIVEAQGTNMIEKNRIYDLRTTVNAVNGLAVSGIFLGNVQNTTVRHNRISHFVARAVSTGLVVGIGFNGGSDPNVFANIYENMFYQPNYAEPNQVRYIGLLDNGATSNRLIYNHNSVYMTGQSGSIPSWAFLRSAGSDANTTLRNNILVNARIDGGVIHYAAGNQTPTATSTQFDSDYNFLAGRGINNDALYMDLGTDPNGTPVTTSAWASGPPSRDSASTFLRVTFFNSSNTFFSASSGDLHLMPTATAGILDSGMETATFNLTEDVDGDPRPPMGNRDRGADELVRVHGADLIHAGNYYNVSFGSGVEYDGNVDVRGYLILNGVVSPTNSDHIVGIGCNVFVLEPGEGRYITGKVRRDFCDQNLIYNSFPIGAGSGYSPVDVSLNPGTTYPSSMTINAVDDFLPGLLQVNGVSRYFSITKTGNPNVDLALHYRDVDVNGNESSYRAFRRVNGTTSMVPSAPNALDNFVYVQNVTQFSDWGIGSLAPTAAEMDLSGTVKTAGGLPIRNVIVTVAGGGLSGPISVNTGSLGNYHFRALPAGNYVVSVSSKRFYFDNPSRFVDLNTEQLVDFVASPNE